VDPVAEALVHIRSATLINLAFAAEFFKGTKSRIISHKLCGTSTHFRSHRLHSWDPAKHLRFVNLCNFKTLDRFKRSWLATAADIWNGLPADMILLGEVSGWRTVLKDIKHYISN